VAVAGIVVRGQLLEQSFLARHVRVAFPGVHGVGARPAAVRLNGLTEGEEGVAAVGADLHQGAWAQRRHDPERKGDMADPMLEGFEAERLAQGFLANADALEGLAQATLHEVKRFLIITHGSAPQLRSPAQGAGVLLGAGRLPFEDEAAVRR
jgi:hypothetical protein